MSGMQDSRVLSAFLQGIQRAYMISVEQRISSSSAAISRLSGGSSGGSARLNHKIASSTSSFSTTSSTAVDVTNLTFNFKTYGGDILLFGWAQDFYCNTTAQCTAEVGFDVAGTQQWSWQHAVAGTAENDTFGLSALALFSRPAGTHTTKLIARTNAGTLNIRAGSDWPMFLLAVEI